MQFPLRAWPVVLALTCLSWAGCTPGDGPVVGAGAKSPERGEPSELTAPAGVSTNHVARHQKSFGPHANYILTLEQAWQLDAPEGQRFDASALLMRTNGELWTLSDRGASLYRIEFQPGLTSAKLVLIPDWFTPAQMAALAPEKHGRFDCEGMAQDAQGRVYVCEEADRWILRCDPATHKVERLEISWKPVKKYFSHQNHNASFEGVAVGGDRLYIANERDQGRIIVVDLKTQKVVDDFTVATGRWFNKDVHYSDLSWFEGALFALLREKHVVLKLDPTSHAVLAEYDYSALESRPELAYHTRSGTGVMEGLAVTKDHLWLVTDNNGLPRKRYPDDARPTLLKCPRPDRGL